MADNPDLQQYSGLPSFADYLPDPALLSLRAQAGNAVAPMAEPPATGTGNWFTAGLGSGFHGALSQLGGAGQAIGKTLGAQGFEQASADYAAQERAKAATYRREDLEASPWSPAGIGYQVAQGLPATAGIVGAGLGAAAAAPLLGVGAGGAAVAGALSAGAAAYPFAVGSNVERAEGYKGKLDQGDAARALLWGVPEAAAQAILPVKAEGMLLRGVEGGLTRHIATAAGVQAGAGAATEFMTGQMGDPNRGFADRAGEIVSAALAGGVQGALFGGAAHVGRLALDQISKLRPEATSNNQLEDAVDANTQSGPKLLPPPSAFSTPSTPTEGEPPSAMSGEVLAGKAAPAEGEVEGAPKQLEYQPTVGSAEPIPMTGEVDADATRREAMTKAQERLQAMPVDRLLGILNEGIKPGRPPEVASMIVAELQRRLAVQQGELGVTGGGTGLTGENPPIQQQLPFPKPGEPDQPQLPMATPGEYQPDLFEGPQSGAPRPFQLPAGEVPEGPAPEPVPDFFAKSVKQLSVTDKTAIGAAQITDKASAQKAVADAIMARDQADKPQSVRLNKLGQDLGVLDKDGKFVGRFAEQANAPAEGATPAQGELVEGLTSKDVPEQHQARFDRLDAAEKKLGQNIPDDPEVMQLKGQINDAKAALVKPEPGQTGKIEKTTKAIERAVEGKVAQKTLGIEPAPVEAPKPAVTPTEPSPAAQARIKDINDREAQLSKVMSQKPTKPTAQADLNAKPVDTARVGKRVEYAQQALDGLKASLKEQKLPKTITDLVDNHQNGLAVVRRALASPDPVAALRVLPEDHFKSDLSDKLTNYLSEHDLDGPIGKALDAHAEAEADVMSAIRKSKGVLNSERAATAVPRTQLDMDLGRIVDSGGKGSDLLRHIVQNGTAQARSLAARLVQLGVDFSTRFGDPGEAKIDTDRVIEPGQKVWASYNRDFNRANFFDNSDMETSVLHEAVHAATHEALDGKGETARELKRLYEEFKKSTPDQTAYGLNSVHEFVAEAFTNERFRDALKNTPAATGLWARFKDVVSRLLGMNTPAAKSMFDQVMSLGDRAMVEQATGTADPRFYFPSGYAKSPEIFSTQRGLGDLARASDAIDNRSLDALKQEADGRLLGVKYGARKQMLGWTTLDHIAQVYKGLIPSLQKFVDHFNHTATRTDVMAKAALAAKTMVDRLPAKTQHAIRDVMAYNALNMDLEFDWAHNSWLHGAKNAEELKTVFGEGQKLMKVIRSTEGGIEAYRALRSSNSADHFSKLTYHAYELLKRSHPDALAAFGGDPFAEYESRPELHDNPQLADAFWRQKTSKALGILTRLQNEMTGGARAGDVQEVKTLINQTNRSINQASQGAYFHLGRDGHFFVAGHINRDLEGNISASDITRIQNAFKAGGLSDAVIMQGNTNSSIYIRLGSTTEMLKGAAVFKALHEAGALDKTKEISYGEAQEANIYKAVSPYFMQRAIDALASAKQDYPAGIDDTTKKQLDVAHAQQVRDLTRQMLDMLPDTALTKIYQKRFNVQGFSAEMLHNFEHSAISHARGLSALSMSGEMSAAAHAMHEEVRAANSNPQFTANQRLAASQAAGEALIRDRMRGFDTPSTPMDAVRKMTHLVSVGMSPAYVFTLVSQVPMLALPELGKTHGYMKSAMSLVKVTPMTFKLMKAIAQGPEGSTFGIRQETLIKAGIPGATTAFILRHASDFNLGSFTEAMTGHNADTALGHAFHWANAMGRYAEMLPRLMTALAAKDLYESAPEKANGRTLDQFVTDKVQNSQYNWNPALNARQTTRAGMFGAMSPMINQFMGFQIRMTEKLYRESADMFAAARPGEDPAAAKVRRAEAQRWMLGHAAATTMLAGTLGLPMLAVAASVYDRLADWATDSDSHDIIASYRTFLAHTFGKETGEVIARGLPRAFGADFGHLGEGRIAPGSSFLLLATEKRKLEDAERDWAKGMAGSSSGYVMNLFAAGRDLTNGDYMDSMIRVMPELFKSPSEAIRLGMRGFVDKNGAPLPINKPTVRDIAFKALGIDPAKEEEYSEVKKTEVGLKTMEALHEQNIERHLEIAKHRNDPAMFQQWTSEAMRYQHEHPGMPSPIAEFGRTFGEHLRASALARGAGMPVGVSPRDIITRGMVSYGNLSRE